MMGYLDVFYLLALIIKLSLAFFSSLFEMCRFSEMLVKNSNMF